MTANTNFGEISDLIESIEMVLEKFEGDELLEDGRPNPDRILLERIRLVDGELVKHEWFDKDGNITKTEGGN